MERCTRAETPTQPRRRHTKAFNLAFMFAFHRLFFINYHKISSKTSMRRSLAAELFLGVVVVASFDFIKKDIHQLGVAEAVKADFNLVNLKMNFAR